MGHSDALAVAGWVLLAVAVGLVVVCIPAKWAAALVADGATFYWAFLMAGVALGIAGLLVLWLAWMVRR
jgi:hypothetical protein